MDMNILLHIPKLNLETVNMFLEKHKLTDGAVTNSQTRSLTMEQTHSKFAIVSIELDNKKNRKNTAQRTMNVEINETKANAAVKYHNKAGDKKHVIVLGFTGKEQNIDCAICVQCTLAKENCSAIPCFMYCIQRQYQGMNTAKEHKPTVRTEENVAKKRMLKRECCVLVERVDLANYNVIQTTVNAKPVLKKIQVENIPYTPQQLETARKLSMVYLIREFEGDDADQFLRFCTERMSARVCKTVSLLTIGQADTELWHELRVGRITASRMREAARCTLLNGSLQKSIMGASSGFSFAMKRGTDLEGHVFAELHKEYPGLRNAGLMLDPKCPWMGASPDGICDDFVLEIKCPYTEKTHACYVDVAKLAPKYYTQIQLQMHVTRRNKALLAVAALDFENTNEITKVWIKYDKAYVDSVIQEAFEYWRKAIFKALLRKRTSKQ
uniref:YqaJ viral recombinase domain-containing protein n=1 Tax=Anopheles culicifacies TaxID=139723 RepID=A0A182LXT9_9DIPT